MAGFFIILAAIYYCWNAYVLPVRADEAYLYLKSMGLSWSTLAPTGLIEYILKGMDFFGSSAFQLRLPSIIFISFSALIIYELTLKISNIYGAWFSMILFFVSPSITYSYISMTPNALLIFCFASYIYAFYMVTSDKDKSVKYYVWMAVSIICAISVDFSGILILLNQIIYILIKRDIRSDKKYLLVIILSSAALMIFAACHYYGIFDLFYKYPVEFGNHFAYRLLLFIIIYLPVIFIIFAAIRNKKIDDTMLPLFISCIVFAAGGIIFSAVYDYDVRNLGALLIPALVLSGYYYEMYDYKITIGVITTVLMLVSVYTNISSNSFLKPKYMDNIRMYESIRMSIQDISGSYGSCIFSYDPQLSSILAYNTFTYPEACTVTECRSVSGVFVSKEKEDDLSKFFSEVQEANIYRFMSIKDGKSTFYFYKVSGLKKNQQ